MNLELYPEAIYEVHDPRDARIVAMFFQREDAEEYIQWKGGK